MTFLTRIGIVATLLVVMTGCSQPEPSALPPGTFPNSRTYWGQFFERGTTAPKTISSTGGAVVDNTPKPVRSDEKRREETDMSDTLVQLQELFRQSNAFITNFPTAEGGYVTITGAMQKALDPDKTGPAKSPSPADSKRFGEIATRTTTRLDEQRTKIHVVQSTFEDKESLVMNHAAELEKICSGTPPASMAQACPHLFEVLSLLRLKLDMVSAGFTHTEVVYQQEHNAQQAMAQKYHAGL